MEEKFDEYDIFLETWEPSPLLSHTVLDSNLFDPLAQARLQADVTARGDVTRTVNVPGIKAMTEEERVVRRFEFFKRTRSEWSTEFRDRLLGVGIESCKVDAFIAAMATDWVDGRKRRQDSEIMVRIKASIQKHDRKMHRAHAGKFVDYSVPDHVDPLFDVSEMANIFTINNQMLEAYMANYLGELDGDLGNSINTIYVRRGVAMPNTPGDERRELHYLSSFSLALTPVEQFAQTCPKQSTDRMLPCIFSAPLPALQDRVVAFTPFIEGMDLGQLELVVAPPILPTPLRHAGTFGGINDYEFF